MSQKLSERHISDDSLESVIENFHLGFAVAPAIAAILATIVGFGKTVHLGIELSFVIAVIIINFIILWLKSKTDEGKELSLFYTFRTNKLLPVQSGKKESYKVEIAVIEDKDKSYFRESLQDNFKKEVSFEEFSKYLLTLPKFKNLNLDEQEFRNHILREIKDRNLYFNPIEIDNSKNYTEESKWVNDKLEKVTAVVVVRTSELEEKSDIYDAVNIWAFQNQNSEVPILFAKNPNLTFANENKTAGKFIPIPDDPNSLPWRLLKRAKERGRSWRIQAKYNRAMVWNIFYLALMCVYIGAIWIVSQDVKLNEKTRQFEATITEKTRQLEAARDGVNDAIISEKQFRKFTQIKDDEKLNVSYWFWNNGLPTLFATTENPHQTFTLPNTKEYMIGCGFKFPNHVVEWRIGQEKDINTSNVMVYDNYDRPIENHGCKMGLLPTNKAKTIICATFNGKNSKEDDANTVGICVFTENESNKDFKDFVNEQTAPIKYRDFLRQRVQDYYEKYSTLIESKAIIPLEQIEKKK